MSAIGQNIKHMLHAIANLERRWQRPAGAVQLLAVSKTMPVDALREAMAAGQRRFGESYLQEALDKMAGLRDAAPEWHFIGPIQSNKTRAIAEHFDWVHSVDRLKIARRLSEQRPRDRGPLAVCLQVNIDREDGKAGCDPDQAPALADAIARLPGLHLRGLMTLPMRRQGLDAQREPFRALRTLYDTLRTHYPALDTLSMGMTGDMEAAIAEGATIVRVGTGIFGPRG